MRLFGFIILSAFLASCGQIKDEGGSSSSLRFGEAIKPVIRLDEAQLAFATEVCNAIKYKRLNFPTNYFGYNFKFDVNEQTCEQPQVNSNRINAQLMADQFVSTYTGNYHKTLETEISGVFTNFCGSLTNGIVPLNTEAVAVDTVRQYVFTSSGSDIKLTLTYAKRVDANSPYISFKADELLMTYQSGVAFRGMVVDRRTSEACPQGSTVGVKFLRTTFSP